MGLDGAKTRNVSDTPGSGLSTPVILDGVQLAQAQWNAYILIVIDGWDK